MPSPIDPFRNYPVFRGGIADPRESRLRELDLVQPDEKMRSSGASACGRKSAGAPRRERGRWRASTVFK